MGYTAKRQIPPPHRTTNKTPRSASWKNFTRSCFAANPTKAVTRPTYIHWTEDPSHALLLKLPNVTVAAGGLPPYSSTAFHSHHHNTFVLAFTDTPTLILENLRPPDYIHSQPQQSISLISGTRFSQCPFSSKLPFVHRAFTTRHRVAFLMVESSLPTLSQSAPLFVIAENSAVTWETTTPTNFWATVELKLNSGADATLDTRSSACPLPLARFICPVQCSLDSLKVQIPKHLQRETVQTTIGGTFVETVAITGFKDSTDTCLTIQNTGQKSWSGVIVDIFGLVSTSTSKLGKSACVLRA